ncbi:MAG: hypothetical protein QNJ77_08155 [Acidimicrobiia bacterium]|nr:hypothetical protein [Acidimicrobiia bacterium]
MRRLLLIGALCTVLVAGCGGSADVERICELNDEFAALNERTLPNIEDNPYPEPAMLEENFVGGIELTSRMVDDAPDAIRDDLAVYLEWMEKLNGLYAEFGYDRDALWSTMDEETYVNEYSFDEAGRTRIRDWFVENCGIDLQG